jgi:pentatricopeptide repeat protein
MEAYLYNYMAFLDLHLGPFAQEIAVIVVFTFSFVMWRSLKTFRPVNKRSSKLNSYVAPRNKNAAASAVHEEVVPSHVKAAEKEMIKCLDQREFTRALNMYRCLERDGRDRFFSEDLFSAFIQSAIRVGKTDVVDRMLRAMRRHQLKPSQQFWQTTLKMLSSRKHFSSCLAAYGHFGKQIPLDKIVFSCLVNASLEVGTPDKALPIMERYEAGADMKDYVLFFRTYVALNDADAAEKCFRNLGPKCTTLMLNLFLLTCVNVKDAARAHRALEEAHRFEDESLCEAKIADVVSYNTVIKGYAQAFEPTKCFDCLHAMLKRQLEPDDITFGTLLDACIVDNDISAANEVVNLLMDRDRPMDTVMSTLFIKGLVRANCVSKALQLYEEMRRREGAHPDIVTYSVLIKGLVDQHELDRALSMLEDLRQAGLQPDDIILTHLLEGCRHSSQHDLGKKLFSDLVASGVKPSEFTLVTMLKLHGRCGAHEEAVELVKTWEATYGLKPSVIHFTCIMSGCLRTKRYDQAWESYKLMCAQDITPDATTVSTLLPGLVAAQQWPRILILVRKAFASNSRMSIAPEVLNNALSQMILSSSARAEDILFDAAGLTSTAASREEQLPPYKCAEQLQQLMRDAGVPITARNIQRMR